jgi:hypothetical protein
MQLESANRSVPMQRFRLFTGARRKTADEFATPGRRTVTADGFTVELDLSGQVLAVGGRSTGTLTSNEPTKPALPRRR